MKKNEPQLVGAASKINKSLDGDYGEGVEVEREMRRLGCSAIAAKRAVRRGLALAEMPNTLALLSEGDINAEHADALVKATDSAGTEEVDACGRLLGIAMESNPERTRRVVGAWITDHVGGMTENERYETQRKLRAMSFGQTDEGLLRATVLMDPVGGSGFRAIIDDAAQRFFEADRADARNRDDAPEPRTFTQCRVDALEALLGINTQRARRQHPDEHPHRIWGQINVDWKGPRPAPLPPLAGAHRAGLPVGGSGECSEGLSGAVAGGLRPRNQVVIVADAQSVLGDESADIQISDTGDLPLRVFEELCCWADIYGVVFDGPGRPLWHGRKTRTVSDSQWRTLVARDRRCVVCDAAPQWCEAHHVVPWQAPARGPTDIDNLALLCNRCHKQLHDCSAQLVKNDLGFWKIDYDFQRVRHRRRNKSGGNEENTEKGGDTGKLAKLNGQTESDANPDADQHNLPQRE